MLSESSRRPPIAMDIELFIRLVEWAHETAASDVELHLMTENVERLVGERGSLMMGDYDQIVQTAKDPEAGGPDHD